MQAKLLCVIFHDFLYISISASGTAGNDADMASVMGFSGFGKKARTFDLDAIFEQTRRTAIERSQKVTEQREMKDAEKQKRALMRGDSHADKASTSGGKGRPATSSSSSSSSDSEDDSEDELIGPPPPGQLSSRRAAEEDEEFVGPPLPPGYKDSDDDDEEEEDDDVCIYEFQGTQGFAADGMTDNTGFKMPKRMRIDITKNISMISDNGADISERSENNVSVMGDVGISKYAAPRCEASAVESRDCDSDTDSSYSYKLSASRQNPVKRIPDTHEITLQHGTKTVSALGLDPSGARLVTGGFDYDVKFWDFAGMDSALQAFRCLQPCECHQIRSLQYSITGDVILVVSGNSQAKILDRDGFQVIECVKGDQYIVDMANTKAKILDRDGFQVIECVKGDQYIVDMANTKGHTAMLNSGCWHPKIKEEFLTCSNDGTVRTWDVTNEKKHKNVFKPRSMQGKRVIPTCCTYSRDGKLIAAGCQDGTIQIWDRNLSVSILQYKL
ncbi:UNVERIFIED_CONTAM: hypothetical protein FKN15_068137 [Acipenser sinensis]